MKLRLRISSWPRFISQRAARHQALEQVGGLGPAGAAVGVDRRGVGEPRVHLHVDLRRRVLAGQQGRVEDGRHGRREGRQVGAQVGVGVHAQREELAVLVHRHLGVAHVVAAVRVGQEALRALGRPLDAAVELLGGPGQARRPRRTGRSSSRSRRRRRARSRAPCARAGRARRPSSAGARRAGSGWTRRACTPRSPRL